jgi:nicotinate-nucleotide pyrophosphorylase (carboxylating)
MLGFGWQTIVTRALEEDLGLGDLTVDALPGLEQRVSASINARSACVVAGLAVAAEVFRQVDPAISVATLVTDGAAVPRKTPLATVQGSAASILKAERVALNFLQHLSGIATTTHQLVDAMAGTACRLTDTRKTTPGLRMLEKHAVVLGGGSPHRYNLGTAVMLKDNHLSQFTSVAQAIQAVRAKVSHTVKIEVEVETFDQLQAAAGAGADVVLLDNMTPEQVANCVAWVQAHTPHCITEASGGITLETVGLYAQTGVPYISTSAITLGAPAVDIGLDF